MVKFLLKNVNGQWDEVTEYVWKNRKHAVTHDGKDLYPKGYPSAAIIGDEITISGIVTKNEMGWISRLFNTVIPAGQAYGTARGFSAQPEFVEFRKGKATVKLELATGEIWSRVRAAVTKKETVQQG